MPRGQEKSIVGGEISPYVQSSMQQNKQQAENRLVSAMREQGETERTAMREAGAGERASLQAQTQREGMAAQAESDDKRAAEVERARRDDREFTETMAKINQEFRAKESALERDMQTAMVDKNIKAKEEIAARGRSLDRFRALLGEKSQIRNSNLMISLVRGGRKSEANKEKRKTAIYAEADQFDKDKKVYTTVKESVTESITNDKRMDLPAREPRPAFRGAGAGMTYALPQESMEKIADPMGVLQTQIINEEGKISVEDLSSANIHKVEEQIIKGELQTEDINRTLGTIEAMLDSVDTKRSSVDKKSNEFDFWNDQHIEISQLKRNLTRLEDSSKKIEGSETQTVGKTLIYALKTIRDGSLGNRVSRYRATLGDEDFDALENSLSGAIEPYEPFEITEDLDKYDMENYTFFNEMIMPLYEKQQAKTISNWGAD